MSDAPIDVWIDTDTAIGIPGADVDDGLALVQAFHSPELIVRGISSVFGNAPLEQTHPIATEVVERFGPAGLEVARGASSAGELGQASPAAEALSDALRERPLHLVALGPVTNLASAFMLDHELAGRVLSLTMVAARRPGQHFLSVPDQPTPFPDLNFDCDPTGMHVLLNSGVPLVFAPWEVSSHVWIEAADLDQLEAGGGPGAYIAEHSRPWLAIWQEQLRAPGFNPFDTLAIAWLTHPHWLEHFHCGVWIEEAPDDTAPEDAQAAGAAKPHLLVDADRSHDLRKAIYCHRPSTEFKSMLLERLIAPAL
jgi:pyrimidine-specific ribonucleoside hydrolase